MQPINKRQRSPTLSEPSSSDDDRDAFVCDCETPHTTPNSTIGQVILCRKCMNNQHLTCWSSSEAIEGSRHPLCNRCQSDALAQIIQDRRAQIAKAAKMLEDKRREKDELYGEVLWGYVSPLCLLQLVPAELF